MTFSVHTILRTLKVTNPHYANPKPDCDFYTNPRFNFLVGQYLLPGDNEQILRLFCPGPEAVTISDMYCIGKFCNVGKKIIAICWSRSMRDFPSLDGAAMPAIAVRGKMEEIRGVTIPALDPAPESDLWPFWDSNSGSRLLKIRIHLGFGSTSGSGSDSGS